ncbi:DUF192 domain-containing protein [Ornithinibacillus californiensis]|uniref:DUF192 domain-containing protein n=1 Tax=Ornithinibacillus californiensis TaxID=161536 RepID=UPI00064D8FCB|nr:DUF192 domain-containing protein [Ornithinibacillus californiensis]
MQLINLSDDKIIASHIKTAYSFGKRLKGLMFTKSLDWDAGLHIKPCLSVHTFFMKYAIDVLYLNKENEVVAFDEALPPGKVGKRYAGVASVLELKEGTISKSQIEIGHKIILKN